jgi:hypothetical protein
MIRQGVMCRGDVSLLTMRWDPTQLLPLGNSSSPHKCVNWDRLNSWAEGRAVDVLKPGYLVHPTLGVSFPDGHGDNLGQVFEHSHVQ